MALFPRIPRNKITLKDFGMTIQHKMAVVVKVF